MRIRRKKLFSRMAVFAVGRVLRRWEDDIFAVVLLPDGQTVHNTFFDRRFTP